MAAAKESNKSSYEFLESAAFNAIADEKNAKTRMSYIERFTPAFPASQFDEQVTQYALFTLDQLNDSARLYAYGEKALAANPNSMPTMLLLANAYVEDARPASWAKAITYAQKVIAMAKGDAPDADRSQQAVGWRRAFHPGLRLRQAGKSGGSHSRAEGGRGSPERTGRHLVRDCALPAGMGLRQDQPDRRGPRRARRGDQDSGAIAGTVPGTAEQGQFRTDETQIVQGPPEPFRRRPWHKAEVAKVRSL